MNLFYSSVFYLFRQFRFVLITLLILSAFTIQAQTKNETMTLYFIRHAEKQKSDSSDPDLAPEGMERALRWEAVFRDVPLTAVYSTDYKRTRNTAGPVAVDHGLSVLIYRTDTINWPRFIAEHPGESMLFVGHSNTIPGMVNNIIGTNKYAGIAHNNNGNLYIITIIDGVAHSILLHID